MKANTTMSTPFVASVSHVTNMAVSNLANGNYNEAAYLLQKTLKTLKDRINMPSEKLTDRIHYKADSVPVLSDAIAQAITDGTFAFSDRFFLIPSVCDERRPEDLHFMSFVNMYNLGMIHHHVALRTGRTWDFARAVQLYNFAVSIVQKFPEDNTAIVRVLCSLYNNLGHAYEQLGAFQCSQSSLESMLQILEAVLASVNQGHLLAEDDFDFYYQYCGMGAGRSFCAAPMA